MKWLADSLWISLGASLGANGRYWLSRFVQATTAGPFPWGTFVVNVSGCFGIGLIAGLLLGFQASPTWRNLLIVGFLGGYTTFSTFSSETYRLIQNHDYTFAVANITGSVVVGLIGTWLGDLLSQAFTRGRP